MDTLTSKLFKWISDIKIDIRSRKFLNGDDRVASAAVLGQGVACRGLTSQSITIDTVILPTLTLSFRQNDFVMFRKF
jgi:hypothetical protein